MISSFWNDSKQKRRFECENAVELSLSVYIEAENMQNIVLVKGMFSAKNGCFYWLENE